MTLWGLLLPPLEAPHETTELQRAVNSETLTTLVELGNTGACIRILNNLRDSYRFDSVGLVMDGETSPNWSQTTMNSDFANALKRTLTDTGPVVDVFACRIHINDLAVYQLSANLGSGVKVYISTNRTGNKLTGQDWLMEKCLIDRVPDESYAGTRDLKEQYFTVEILKSTVNFAMRNRMHVSF